MTSKRTVGGNESVPTPRKTKGAFIIGDYRYLLYRIWDFDKPKVTWIMLNPSTADENKDDPTIRRCIGFAKTLGYGGINVVNLFPYIASSPQVLKAAPNPDGHDFRNKNNIYRACKEPKTLVICAWGTHGSWRGMGNFTTFDLQYKSINLWRLGPRTKSGHPRHPLYLSGDTKLERHG